MRKFSAILVAGMLLMTANILANDSFVTDPVKDLPSQIGELLAVNYVYVKEKDLKANVVFTLNRDSEIVVLSIDTNNRNLESFIKRRLNYQKVVLEEPLIGGIYKVPVRITR